MYARSRSKIMVLPGLGGGDDLLNPRSRNPRFLWSTEIEGKQVGNSKPYNITWEQDHNVHQESKQESCFIKMVEKQD